MVWVGEEAGEIGVVRELPQGQQPFLGFNCDSREGDKTKLVHSTHTSHFFFFIPVRKFRPKQYSFQKISEGLFFFL